MQCVTSLNCPLADEGLSALSRAPPDEAEAVTTI